MTSLPEILIKEWQDALALETDTRKYRLIMQTIAFLQGVQATREEQAKAESPEGKGNGEEAHS